MSEITTAQRILYISQQYTIYVSFVILISGVIGNICKIIVFSQLKILRKTPSAFYIISEDIVNLIILFIPFVFRIGINAFNYDPSQTSIVWCKLRQAIGLTCTLITLTIVCFASIDQYLSTNHQPYIRRLSSIRLAKILTISSIIFWLFHSIPLLVFLEIQPSAGCSIYNRGLLTYITFFYYPILSGLLPLLLSSFFSLLAYRNVRRLVRRQIPIEQRRLDRQLTSMILTRVFLLFILVFPYTIQRIYSLISPAPRTEYVRAAIEQFVGAVTISFIYSSHIVRRYEFSVEIYLIDFYLGAFLCVYFNISTISSAN